VDPYIERHKNIVRSDNLGQSDPGLHSSTWWLSAVGCKHFS
jgi:hypothetical protein